MIKSSRLGVSKLNITDSDNGLLPGQRQAIIWTNVGILSIDQSHRCGRPQVACHEPAGSYDKTTRAAIFFFNIKRNIF